MTVFADTCAKALLDLNISKEEIQSCRALFSDMALSNALNNPTIELNEKEAVIDKLFPKATQSFWKLLCSDGWINEAENIFEAYDAAILKKENCVSAELTYVTEPSDEQKEKIKEMICRIKKADSVRLSCRADKALIGGYCLQIGDTKYDKSIRSGLESLQRALRRR